MKVENRYSYQILKVLAFKIYFIDFSQKKIVSQIKKLHNHIHCTKVRFSRFFSGGFITAIVVNPPKKKLAKCTSVNCTVLHNFWPKKIFITSINVGKL